MGQTTVEGIKLLFANISLTMNFIVLLMLLHYYHDYLQMYGRDERNMRRAWKRVRKIISKPKFEFRKKDDNNISTECP